MRTLEHIQQLTYKNTLVVIWDCLLLFKKPIQEITLLEFQHHIGQQLKSIWWSTKEQQDDQVIQIEQKRI